MVKRHLLYIIMMLCCSYLFAASNQYEISNHISNYDVNVITQDCRGYVWMGTDRGLNRYNGSVYQTWYAGSSDGSLLGDNIQSMVFDSEGRLWMCTEYGLVRYHNGQFYHHNDAVFNLTSKVLDYDEDHIVMIGKDGFVKFAKDPVQVTAVFNTAGTSSIDHVTVTSSNELWFVNQAEGQTWLYALDAGLNLVSKHSLGKDIEVYSMCEDVFRVVWLATDQGMVCYDSRSGSKLPVPNQVKSFGTDDKVHFVLPFRNNNLLIGVQGQGIYDYNISSGLINHLAKEQKLPLEEYTCFVDKDQNIWLSDHQSEVLVYMGERPYQHVYPTDDIHSISELHNLEFDPEGYLWMLFNKRLVSMDITNSDKLTYESSRSDIYVDLMFDSTGHLWTIHNDNRISKYQTKGGKPHLVDEYVIDNDVFSLYESHDGCIVASSVRSLYQIDENGSITRIIPENMRIFSLTLQDKRSRDAYAFTVDGDGLMKINDDFKFQPLNNGKYKGASYIMTASDGALWIGFNKTGLVRYDPATGEETVYDHSSGLVDYSVKSIEEDNDGNIWFSTSQHITKLEVATGRLSVLHDDRFNGSKRYYLVSSAKGSDGKLYFAGTGGITVINPQEAIPSAKKIPINVDDILVNGRSLGPDANSLTLTHKENVLEFRFAAVDFTAGNSINYSYKLDGYEQNWNYTGNIAAAQYRYLPPGKYTFIARVRESSGTWSSDQIVVPIRIKPSPWLSPLAKFIYFILFAGIVVATIYIYLRLRIQKDRIALADAREQMNMQHHEFISNIAHEFKTPLSMIYAPARELSKMVQKDSAASMYVDTIQRNADRLKVISKEIFDVIQNPNTDDKLNVSKADLDYLIRSLTDNFRYSAIEKSITINLHSTSALVCLFDEEKITKIFTNLLSNALKYSQYGGEIEIEVKSNGKYASITVKDNSVGVEPEKISRLFSRFDRLDADIKKPKIEGSGIGLNYAMRLAKIHKGTITYTNNTPSGSIFTLEIPVSIDAYELDQVKSLDYEEKNQPVHVPVEETVDSDKKGTLLIVEDNPDVKGFLATLFSKDYNVLTASDGLEAEDLLKITLPDLVLSDCVMPNKSGEELCYDIKHSDEWSHLPVVLLTAKNDHKSTIHGIRQGADVYIAKPFEPEYLATVIETQIQNRRLVQNKILNLTSTSIKLEAEADAPIMNVAGTEFINKIHSVLDANMDNDMFGINELASEMSMSYSALYSKVKSLTGTTPQAYVKTYRMNVAIELLRSGLYSVGEVADKVGSSSPFTFSREFKAHFGFPPSKAKQNQPAK